MNPEALQMLLALQGGNQGAGMQGAPGMGGGAAMPMYNDMNGAQSQQGSLGNSNDYMSVLNSAPPMTPPPQGIF